MRLWHILQSRLRSLFFRDRRESDLREELQFHLERETERLQASGMPRDAARLQALRLFGGVEQIKDACRDARGTALVDSVVRDVRLRLSLVPPGAPGRPDDCDDGGARPRAGGRRVHAPQRVPLSRRRRCRNPHELFAVERQRSADGGARGASRARSIDALVRETGVFSDAFATTPDIDSRIDGRRMEGPLVTGNFFHVLGVSAARRTHAHAAGRRASAAVRSLSSAIAPGPGISRAIPACSAAWCW